MRSTIGLVCAAVICGAQPVQAAVYRFDANIDFGSLGMQTYALNAVIPDSVVASGSLNLTASGDPFFGDVTYTGPWSGFSIDLPFPSYFAQIAFGFLDGNIAGGSVTYDTVIGGTDNYALTLASDSAGIWSGTFSQDNQSNCPCAISGGVWTLASDPAPVPEPPPLAVLAMAAAGFLGVTRRRGQSAV